MTINNEGSKPYMHDRTDSVKETVFQRITDRESKYLSIAEFYGVKLGRGSKGTKGGFSEQYCRVDINSH